MLIVSCRKASVAAARQSLQYYIYCMHGGYIYVYVLRSAEVHSSLGQRQEEYGSCVNGSRRRSHQCMLLCEYSISRSEGVARTHLCIKRDFHGLRVPSGMFISMLALMSAVGRSRG